MEQSKLEKIAETFKDTEFVDKIIEIKDKAELINAFAEKGLELSMAEIDTIIQKGQEFISSGEFDRITKAISENELENISGGTATTDFLAGVRGLTDVIETAAHTVATPSNHDSSEYVAALGTLAIPTAATLAVAAPVLYGTCKAIKKSKEAITNAVTKTSAAISRHSDEIRHAAALGAVATTFSAGLIACALAPRH